MSATESYVTRLCLQYLSEQEAEQIQIRFRSEAFRRTQQVLWTGMAQQTAQQWADGHGMQTLTTAMGSLKSRGHLSTKTNKQWSTHIKGASLLFAYHVARGEEVVVLSPPPPARFHPSGKTTYQLIEEPVLKGLCGNAAVGRIDMVHPSITLTEDFRYQIWPIDESYHWTERFKDVIVSSPHWRLIKSRISDRLCALGYDAERRAETSVEPVLQRAPKQDTEESITQVAVRVQRQKSVSSDRSSNARMRNGKRTTPDSSLSQNGKQAILQLKMGGRLTKIKKSRSQVEDTAALKTQPSWANPATLTIPTSTEKAGTAKKTKRPRRRISRRRRRRLRLIEAAEYLERTQKDTPDSPVALARPDVGTFCKVQPCKPGAQPEY